MNEMFETLREHKMSLIVVLTLTVLCGIWKFTPHQEHITGRQLTIERATNGF